MPFGARVRENGVVIWDANTRMTRRIGTITIPASPTQGSINVPGFALGTPYWVITGTGSSTGYFNITPQISVSGLVLSWNWGALPPSPCQLIYGIY